MIWDFEEGKTGLGWVIQYTCKVRYGAAAEVSHPNGAAAEASHPNGAI